MPLSRVEKSNGSSTSGDSVDEEVDAGADSFLEDFPPFFRTGGVLVNVRTLEGRCWVERGVVNWMRIGLFLVSH